MSFDLNKALAFLDKVEAGLDGLQGWLDNTFASINSYGQEGVDAICTWAGEWVSYKIEQFERLVVKGLHGAYKGALEALQIGGPIYELATGGISADLGELVKGLLKVAFPWVEPTLAAIETIITVPTKIINIVSKVSSLASYRPNIQTPGITLDNFQINPKIISMADVITGNFEVDGPPAPFTIYMQQALAKNKEKIAKARKEAGQTTSFKEAIGINQSKA